jgi:hypothetical protein
MIFVLNICDNQSSNSPGSKQSRILSPCLCLKIELSVVIDAIKVIIYS